MRADAYNYGAEATFAPRSRLEPAIYGTTDPAPRGTPESARRSSKESRVTFQADVEVAAPYAGGVQPRLVKVVEHKVRKLWLFPTAFTLFCFTAYLIPIYLISTYIGLDMNTQYFLGRSTGRPVLFLPILYLFTHVMHVCMGRPSKILVIVCLFGSSLLMLVLGDGIAKASSRNADGLLAQNCDSFRAKMELETQWQRARTFYATCILATSQEAKNMTFQQGIQKYRIADCAGYETQLALNPGWTYLQNLEERQHCAGWCSKSQALWTFDTVKESCTIVVGELMNKKISRAAYQVVAYSMFAIIFVTISAWVGGPVLKEWFG